MRTQVLEHHIKFGQRIDDHRAGEECRTEVMACTVLYVTDGKKQIHRPLRAFGVADARYPRVPCLKHEVLEHVRFVHKNMVYAHRMEIHGIIFPLIDFHPQFGEFRFQILLPLLQSFLHLPAAVAHGGVLQYLKAALHIGKFFGENLHHGYFRLRYLCELVVCQDDAVPVIVFDFSKHLFPVGRREVLLARIE